MIQYQPNWIDCKSDCCYHFEGEKSAEMKRTRLHKWKRNLFPFLYQIFELVFFFFYFIEKIFNAGRFRLYWLPASGPLGPWRPIRFMCGLFLIVAELLQMKKSSPLFLFICCQRIQNDGDDAGVRGLVGAVCILLSAELFLVLFFFWCFSGSFLVGQLCVHSPVYEPKLVILRGQFKWESDKFYSHFIPAYSL